MGLGNCGGSKGQRAKGTVDTMGQIWNTRVTPQRRGAMVGLEHHGGHQQKGRGGHQGTEVESVCMELQEHDGHCRVG